MLVRDNLEWFIMIASNKTLAQHVNEVVYFDILGMPKVASQAGWE
jgi:hypothetical protein